MEKDKELSTNDEVKRNKEFQERVDLKEKVVAFLKETLVSTTDSVFKKAGYKKNNKEAGEYGDGSKYGAGAVENQYIVTIAGKTKSVLTKKIVMDGKSIASDIEIVFKDNVVNITYKATEQGFFRGVDAAGKTYAINEKISLDASNMESFKKELKSKLESFSEKELGYITSTKLGVADKSDKSTSSVVENFNETKMKKLTIKELYEMDFDSESDIEPNSDKIKSLNTLDLKNTTPPIDSEKQLFFDDEQINETGEWEDDEEGVAWKDALKGMLNTIERVTHGKLRLIDVRGFDKYQGPYGIVEIEGKKYKVWAIEGGMLFIENYPISNSQEGQNKGFEGTAQDVVDLVSDKYDPNQSVTLHKAAPGYDFSINEITTAGPAISDSPGGHKDGAQSGAGGYNTPNAFKKTPYAKAQQKRPKVTHDYKVVPQNEDEKPSDKKEEKKSESKGFEAKKSAGKLQDVTPKNNGKDTKAVQPSNKNLGVEEPLEDQNFNPKHENPTYNNTNQTKAPKSSNDDFWTEVELEPGSGYIPKGMKQNFVAGMHDRAGELKKMGLAENKEILNEEKYYVSLRNGSDTTKKSIIAQSVQNLITKLTQNGIPINNIFEIHDGMGTLIWSETSGRPLQEQTNNSSKPDLTKKKFFSLNENKDKGINKRYLVTEKTTEEYEKERWSKMVNLKTRETIKEAEEMNTFFETLNENKDPETLLNFKPVLNESLNYSSDDIFDEPKKPINENASDNEMIEVENPKSKFGTCFKFFKKDFLSENLYILEVNSKTYIRNPRVK